ncbi:MAG TPA: ABC transporter permease, partial [Treponema sp.]|nr:ABC transporter permease [Treponema sp.]
MTKLAKIIRMEFLLTVANKVFVILTLLGPFLIAGVIFLPGYLAQSNESMNNSIVAIALVNADSRFIDDVAPVLRQSGIEVTAVKRGDSTQNFRHLFESFNGYVIIPEDLSDVARLQYVSNISADFRVSDALQLVLGQAIVARKLEAADISVAKAALLMSPPILESLRLMPNGETEKTPEFVSVLMAGLMFSILLYMTVLLYGQAIGRSVLSEKTNKTVEILLSSVRPTDLLFGKILGKALASLLQYGIWVASGVVVMKVFGARLGFSSGINLSAATFAYLILFFILAFFLFCSIYAALGAASQDEPHLAQLSWPVVIFLMIPVVMISSIITAPHSTLIVGLSFFPLTAPIVMFLRILMGAVQPWEILVSISLVIATTAVVVWLSSRIFRVGILMTGKRFTFREV